MSDDVVAKAYDFLMKKASESKSTFTQQQLADKASATGSDDHEKFMYLLMLHGTKQNSFNKLPVGTVLNKSKDRGVLIALHHLSNNVRDVIYQYLLHAGSEELKKAVA